MAEHGRIQNDEIKNKKKSIVKNCCHDYIGRMQEDETKENAS